jgi:hypothetical protein
LPISSTKNINDSSMNMSCSSTSSCSKKFSMLTSSMHTITTSTSSKINKCLFSEMDMTNVNKVENVNNYETPQLLQNKLEPKMPRIKEARKEKLQFRHKLMKKLAKHRNHLKNLMTTGKSKSPTKSAQLTSSTPFR